MTLFDGGDEPPRGPVLVQADGGSRGNPGPAGYGAVVFDAATGEVLAERHEFIGVDTNNVAEYRGLIAGLAAARELGARDVSVQMDSKLVVEQMSGRWQVKNPALRTLAREAIGLRSAFESVGFEWIPRERNKHADRLANEAMDLGTGRPPRQTSRATVAGPGAASKPGIATDPGAESTGVADPSTWVPPVGPQSRLVLVRHGATAHSGEYRFSGHNDLPLSADGREQAEALARRDWGDVVAVVTSPLRRARQTADPIAAALGLAVTEVAGFAELDFGAFEGLLLDEVRQRYPDELASWWADADAAPPGGESMNALAARVRRAKDTILTAHPGQQVLVVSHVTPIKTLVRAALQAPPASVHRMHLDTASVSAIDYLADGTASLRLFNDTSHRSG